MTQDSSDATYELFDDSDNKVGTGNRLDALKDNLFMRSVHILVIDEDGGILLCKRPSSKKAYPNCYTSSAGGHVEPGEDYRVSAARELQEELGITAELIDYGRFDVINQTERAIHHLFVTYLSNHDIAQLVYDPSEIEKHDIFSLEQIKLAISDKSIGIADSFLKAFELFISKRQIIIDFDHTIFNWYAFKHDLKALLHTSYEIDLGLFETAKEQIEDELSGLYSIQRHMQRIAELSGADTTILNLALGQLCDNGHTYLYPDAQAFLQQTVINGSNVLALLTYGENENQNYFIDLSGARKYAHKVISVDSKEDKLAWFECLANSSGLPAYIINDDPKEGAMITQQLTQKLGGHILVERKDAKYTNIPASEKYAIVSSLNELEIK